MSCYAAAKSLGLTTLPSLVLIRQDGTILESAEGWDPDQWRKITETLDTLTGWTPLNMPGPKDPAPYAGTTLHGSGPTDAA